MSDRLKSKSIDLSRPGLENPVPKKSAFAMPLCAKQKLRIPHSAALLAALLTLFNHAHAESVVASEPNFFQELPVVLTVSRLAQPEADAPSAITVIDREMIEASGFTNVADLLRLVPGFIGGYSDKGRAAGYHGMLDGFSRRMQVLLDGRSVYNPAYGSIDWLTLPVSVDDIERLEVIRGPNSASYGSNAFMAIVNIITSEPSQLNANHVRLLNGNTGTSGWEAHHEGGMEGLDYWLTLSNKRSDNFASRPDSENIKMLSGRLTKHLDISNEIQAIFGLSRVERDYGDYGDLERPPHPTKTDDQSINLVWTHATSPGDELKVQYSHWRYKTLDEWVATVDLPFPPPLYPPALGPSSVRVDANYQSQRDDLEIQQTLTPSDTFRMVVGGGARHDQVQSLHYFNTLDWLDGDLYRLFAHAEWRPHPKWVMNIGTLWEDNYISGSDMAPRAALSWTPASGHTLRLAASSGLRSPTFFEQYGEEIFRASDPTQAVFLRTVFGTDAVRHLYTKATYNLAPEQIDSRELAYLGRFPTSNLNVDIRLFRDNLSDVIDHIGAVTPPAPEDPLNEADRWINQDSLTFRGGEIHFDWRPLRRTRILASYARVAIYSSEVNREKSGPKANYSLLVSQGLSSGLNFSAGLYGMSATKWDGEGGNVPAYRRLDLRLAKTFKIGDTHAELAGVVQNALDSQYSEFDPRLEFERRAYISLAINF